jgi:hypothetical protein
MFAAMSRNRLQSRHRVVILQIVIGAVLTALGSVGRSSDIAITVLAAINTFLAGLLALIHNSGLPDRYRMDKIEFAKVADYIKVCITSIACLGVAALSMHMPAHGTAG